ncbi:hypothetical protein AVEN_257107-1 [Araneus ventricosus]|uniref:Mutator-like transposase domain-containing protein n=1 Tax=Araneus ventricosus TaxID=182803 RepID=A0A4Y2FRP2_ARAVE|nr:hypothetical protein AVEN_257107-1 [Araneus ventricosus]
MDLISKRYRKPKGRPCKRRSAQSANALKRWNKSVDKIDDSVVVETESNKSECIHQKNNVDGELNIISSFAESQTVPSPAYTIMDQNMLSSLLKEVSCNKCESKTLNVHVKGSYGFSHNIAIICETCQHQYNSTFSSEREVSSRKLYVSNKFIKAFLSIGKGHAAFETFSMILGIPAMDSRTFSNFLSDLVIKNKDFRTQVLDLSRDVVRGKYIDCDSSLENEESSDFILSTSVLTSFLSLQITPRPLFWIGLIFFMLRDGLEISFWKSSFRDPCVAVLAGGKRRSAGGFFYLWPLYVLAMFAYVGGRGLWRMRPHHAWRC